MNFPTYVVVLLAMFFLNTDTRIGRIPRQTIRRNLCKRTQIRSLRIRNSTHQRTIFYQTLQAILATKSTIMIQTLSNYTPPQSHGGTPLPPPINPLTHPSAPQTSTTASTNPQSPPHSPTQQPPSHDSGPTTHRRSSRHLATHQQNTDP